jgi:hypothetical protein
VKWEKMLFESFWITIAKAIKNVSQQKGWTGPKNNI